MISSTPRRRVSRWTPPQWSSVRGRPRLSRHSRWRSLRCLSLRPSTPSRGMTGGPPWPLHGARCTRWMPLWTPTTSSPHWARTAWVWSLAPPLRIGHFAGSRQHWGAGASRTTRWTNFLGTPSGFSYLTVHSNSEFLAISDNIWATGPRSRLPTSTPERNAMWSPESGRRWPTNSPHWIWVERDWSGRTSTTPTGKIQWWWPSMMLVRDNLAHLQALPPMQRLGNRVTLLRKDHFGRHRKAQAAGTSWRKGRYQLTRSLIVPDLGGSSQPRWGEKGHRSSRSTSSTPMGAPLAVDGPQIWPVWRSSLWMTMWPTLTPISVVSDASRTTLSPKHGAYLVHKMPLSRRRHPQHPPLIRTTPSRTSQWTPPRKKKRSQRSLWTTPMSALTPESQGQVGCCYFFHGWFLSFQLVFFSTFTCPDVSGQVLHALIPHSSGARG